MKALLSKPWFVVLLALAAVALVANSLWDGGKTTSRGMLTSTDDSAALPGGEAATEEGAKLPINDALKALGSPKGAVRDPFAQRANEPEATTIVEKLVAPDWVDSLHLSALWTQNGATYTLINDRICQPGDKIGRLKIESATQEGVWISHWKGRDFLALGHDFTLRTPVAVSPL